MPLPRCWSVSFILPSLCFRIKHCFHYYKNRVRVHSLSLFTCAQLPNKVDATKSLATLAVSSFSIPGDAGFPLNAFLAKPATRAEAGECSKLTPYVSFIKLAKTLTLQVYALCYWDCLCRPNEGLLHTAASGAGRETGGEGVWRGGKAHQGVLALSSLSRSVQVLFLSVYVFISKFHTRFYFPILHLWMLSLLPSFTCLPLPSPPFPSIPPFLPISVVALFHKETVHGQEPVRSRTMRTLTREFDCYILCLEN